MSFVPIRSARSINESVNSQEEPDSSKAARILSRGEISQEQHDRPARVRHRRRGEISEEDADSFAVVRPSRKSEISQEQHDHQERVIYRRRREISEERRYFFPETRLPRKSEASQEQYDRQERVIYPRRVEISKEELYYPRGGRSRRRSSPTQGLVSLSPTSGFESLQFFGLFSRATVTAFTFSPDGRTLAVATNENVIYLWSTLVKGVFHTVRLSSTERQIDQLIFSPDNNLLAAVSQHGHFSLWNTNGWGRLTHFHSYSVRRTIVAFSCDGKTLAYLSRDGEIRLWNAASGEEIGVVNSSEPFQVIAFLQNDQLLSASSSSAGTIHLWDIKTGQETQRLAGHSEAVFGITVSSNAKLVASVSLDNTVRLWDTYGWQEIRKIEHITPVEMVLFSPKSEFLAILLANMTINIWDTHSWQLARSESRSSVDNALKQQVQLRAYREDTLLRSVPNLAPLSFSTPGNVLTFMLDSHKIVMWRLDDIYEMKSLKGHAGEIKRIAFSNSGELLASSSSGEDIIRLWDTTTAQEVLSFEHEVGIGTTEMSFVDEDRFLSIEQETFAINKNDELRDEFSSRSVVKRHLSVEALSEDRNQSKPPLANMYTREIEIHHDRPGRKAVSNHDTIYGNTSNPTLLVRRIKGAPYFLDEWVHWDSHGRFSCSQTYNITASASFQDMIAIGKSSGQLDLVRFKNQKWAEANIGLLVEHEFRLEWNGQRYLSEQYDDQYSIASVPILWQDLDCIRLETCADLSCHVDGEIVKVLIHLVDLLHKSPALSIVYSGDIRKSGSWFRAKGMCHVSRLDHASTQMPVMQINIQSNLDSAVADAKRVLLLLAAALRPAHESLSWSQATIQSTTSTSSIRLLPLERTLLGGCWMPIFQQKVIARLPSSERLKEGDSLELAMSFDDLIDLSGADIPVDIDGGICLVGVNSVLVPVEIREYDESKSIAWHLLIVDGFESRPSKARKLLWIKLREWSEGRRRFLLKLNDSNELRQFKSHYLGWTESAFITLATEGQPYALRRSNGSTQAYEKATTTFNLSMNIGYSGSGVTASRSHTFGRSELRRPPDPNSTLINQLTECVEEQTVLYNPQRKQAWLVPKIFVLYHLVLERSRYIKSRTGPSIESTPGVDGTENLDARQIGSHDSEVQPFRTSSSVIPYLDPHISNAREACEKLIHNLEIDFPHTPNYDHRLKHALSSILLVLDLFQRPNSTDDRHRTLRGFEAYDAIHQSKFFRLKRATISDSVLSLKSLGGWINLFDDVPLILFYAGIEDPIVPSPGQASKLCKHCLRMPEDENYLAARISSLCELGKPYKEKAKLADSAWWFYQQAWNVNGHELHRNCINHRLQTIFRRPPECPPPRKILDPNHKGAVIFRPGTGWADIFDKTFGGT